MEKRYKQVQPCGMLYSNGREYFLLRPSPEKQLFDWEKWNTFRWLVVPNNPIDEKKLNVDKTVWVYSYPRHVITTNFSIEFMANLSKILVWNISDIELSNLEE
jgi:hypothetical protein